MKTLILFDSYFGNTEKIARAIAEPFETEKEVTIKRNNEITSNELSSFNLIVMGSPTRGFRPTEDVSNLIKSIESEALKGIFVAAFDTRVPGEAIKSRFLRGMVKIGGYAAKPIAERLEKKGATNIIDPEGFYVMDTEGPLKEGELERANAWGKAILDKIKSA